LEVFINSLVYLQKISVKIDTQEVIATIGFSERLGVGFNIAPMLQTLRLYALALCSLP
jgi:hypothetical protein